MGQNASWLLLAAMEHRERQLMEAHGRDITTDACDNGGRQRHRMAARRAPVLSMPRVLITQRPRQLDLWVA